MTEVLGDRQWIRVFEQRRPSLVWEDFDSISTGGTEVYINGSSQTQCFVAGSTVATGNTLTLPTITIASGTGGLTIVVEAAVTANGQLYKAAIEYRVLRPGAPRAK